MDISLDKKSATQALIKINLKEADYQPQVQEKIKEYSKKANIKGFRPGKVPPGMIKKMYGKSILVEEINQLLSQSLSNYIKENDIQLLGEPLPDAEAAANIDWDNQKEFEFQYEIGLVDDFEVEVSDKVKVNKYTIKVDDKNLNETLDNVREQHGTTETVEESKAGDILEGTLTQKDGDIEQQAVLPLKDVEKKEAKKFEGLRKGDTVTFAIEKALKDDAVKAQLLSKQPEEVQDLKGEFTLEVSEVKRTTPAEMNQELFDKVFGKDAVKSEEEFTNKVKDTIAENYNRETENLLNRDIQNTLVENTKFDLPDDFLKRWLLQSNEGKVTAEQIEKEYDLYTKDLRWNLIKNKIAAKNDFEVKHEDVMEHTKNMIKEQFGAYGMSEQLEGNMDSFANNYLQGENGENYMKVHEQIRTERVLEHVKDTIKITEKKVDLDGFKKAVDNN